MKHWTYVIEAVGWVDEGLIGQIDAEVGEVLGAERDGTLIVAREGDQAQLADALERLQNLGLNVTHLHRVPGSHFTTSPPIQWAGPPEAGESIVPTRSPTPR